MSVEVKICGLCRAEDARAAVEAGAAYLGVVFAPSPRRRTPEDARAIWAGAGTRVRRVGVFVDAPPDTVVRLVSELAMDVVQLHGSESPAVCGRIRESGVELWKAVRPSGSRGSSDESRPGAAFEAEVERYTGFVDGILMEGRSPYGHGGVGARFDWSSIERARWPDGVRLILAGGLNPANVARAIEAVRPGVVDVSSGVERRIGAKDGDAMRAFVEAARGARTSG